MKYIKKYEEIESTKFKNGDYVVVIDSNKYLTPEIKKFLRNRVGVVSQIRPNYIEQTYFIKYYDPDKILRFKSYDISTNYDDVVQIDESNLRPATPKEVEKYKIKKLITLDTDKTKLLSEIVNYQNKLKNLNTFVLEQYKEIVK